MHLLSIRDAGAFLPAPTAPWPTPVRCVSLEKLDAVVLIRPAAHPAAAGSLEITGLPRPDGTTLTVPIERLPFHKSPGRWHFRCPCCAQLKGVLVQAVGRCTPAARALGWACRTCAGLPKSRAWPLSPARRLDNALERATEERRRRGEKARDWRRRLGRAEEARRKAQEADRQLAVRLAKL